jgi:elongation factor G
MGNIAQGTTVSDCHVSEKQHQISTQTSLMHCTWRGRKLNILDTPGYLDLMSRLQPFGIYWSSVLRF